ncbi:unnamed protein product [Cylindrotheca closterium]|uniref:PDZ domain-containing protein n=1 Tax=Cylindrotheca closterium TaxID=2856 RepID=A0AAD2FKS3_9STRA|nr:unnamed protein product [Cylindrotheca closterium]
MSTEIPSQQMNAMDEMLSHGSSSSFNLSTDAEDSEYENMRSRGVLPGTVTNLSSLDMSMSISAASNPTSNTGTDQETVFAALDDMTMPSVTTGSKEHSRTSALDPARSQQEEMARKLGLMPPPPPPASRLSTPEDEPGYIPSPSTNDRDFDNWALSPSTEASSDPASIKGIDSNPTSWAISPSTAASNDPLSAKSAGLNQYFGFDEKSMNISRTMIEHKAQRSNKMTSHNFPRTTTRKFTSPQPQASGSSVFSDGFADFADFESFNGWGKETKNSTTSTSFRGDFDRSFENVRPTSSTNQQQRSASVSSQGQTERSLSELLALAKSKDRNNGPSPNTANRSRRTTVASGSNSSVNSAPGYSALYLSQFHNVGKYNKGGYERDGMKPSSPRVANDETSVSDIIESLEVSNQMRRGSGKLNSNMSVGDASSSSISRLARERLREKRRKEYENSGVRSSDESDVSDNGAESWLFDGVAGALGPRGIAADLESLSGRSSRSKNSQGNRSHRSRHSRSRNSTARKPRTSNESTSSRESRHSRGSRYSHRSTRSFISQMSEQSRSVANDLLRLEMQLAMVGQENRDDIPVLGIGSSTVGRTAKGGSTARDRSRGKSYSSSQRTKSSSKRSKVTVIAPPGKLGIILANKADAQGTVVSGVRSSSALVDKISPGDRIIAIDGEDVSRITVSEITVIMSRKAEYERNLTVLTLNKSNDSRRHPDDDATPVKDPHRHEQDHHLSSQEDRSEHYRR